MTPFFNIVEYLPTRIVLTSGNADYATITCGDFVRYYRSGSNYYCCINVKGISSVNIKTDATASQSNAYVYGAVSITSTEGEQLMYIPGSSLNDRNREATLDISGYDYLLMKCSPTYNSYGSTTKFSLTWA